MLSLTFLTSPHLIVPSCLKTAIVISVPKTSAVSSLNNYCYCGSHPPSWWSVLINWFTSTSKITACQPGPSVCFQNQQIHRGSHIQCPPLSLHTPGEQEQLHQNAICWFQLSIEHPWSWLDNTHKQTRLESSDWQSHLLYLSAKQQWTMNNDESSYRKEIHDLAQPRTKRRRIKTTQSIMGTHLQSISKIGEVRCLHRALPSQPTSPFP